MQPLKLALFFQRIFLRIVCFMLCPHRLEKIIRESKNENFSKKKEEEVKRLYTEDHPEGLYFISQRYGPPQQSSYEPE